MSVNESCAVEAVSPYTYQDNTGKAREVLLVGIDAELVGTDNEYPPPTFNVEDLASWLRKGYFFLDGLVYAQVPRRSGAFPFQCNDEDATDVVDATDAVHIYYPVTESQAICLEWEYRTDEWTVDVVDQPAEDESIVTDAGYAAGGQPVWNWRQRNNDRAQPSP